MPNYVSNTICMKGIADLPLFTEKDRAKVFDFNKIIPMPKSLDVTSGSMETISIAYYITERCTIPIPCLSFGRLGLLNRLCHESMGHADTLFCRTLTAAFRLDSDEAREEMYRNGEVYVSNFKKYGATTWYDWCRKNWGTKWNAVDTTIYGRDDEVSFDTAWAPPEPVVAKLAEMYPGTEIHHIWTYEDEPEAEFEKIYNEKEV